jgi:hypothetical protein
MLDWDPKGHRPLRVVLVPIFSGLVIRLGRTGDPCPDLLQPLLQPRGGERPRDTP